MKQYAIFKDHKAQYNNEDKYIKVDTSNVFNLLGELQEEVNNDNTLYLIGLFENIVNNEYKRVAVIRQNNVIEIEDTDITFCLN